MPKPSHHFNVGFALGPANIIMDFLQSEPRTVNGKTCQFFFFKLSGYIYLTFIW